MLVSECQCLLFSVFVEFVVPSLCVSVSHKETELLNVIMTTIIWHNQDESVGAELHKQTLIITSPTPRLETQQTHPPPACWHKAGIKTEDCHLQAKGWYYICLFIQTERLETHTSTKWTFSLCFFKKYQPLEINHATLRTLFFLQH